MHTVNESESIGGNICEELQGVLKSRFLLEEFILQLLVHDGRILYIQFIY